MVIIIIIIIIIMVIIIIDNWMFYLSNHTCVKVSHGGVGYHGGGNEGPLGGNPSLLLSLEWFRILLGLLPGPLCTWAA